MDDGSDLAIISGSGKLPLLIKNTYKNATNFSFTDPEKETEIPHQNWNQRLKEFLCDDPISDVKFHSFYNRNNDQGHDQESGPLPG